MSEVFEKNCRVGVVTSVDDDVAQMLYLHSRKATATESLVAAAELEKDLAFFVSREAIDTDATVSLEIIDYITEDLERQVELPEDGVLTLGGYYAMLSKDSLGTPWGGLKRGSLVHEHAMATKTSLTSERFWEEYCVSPFTLDEQGIIRAISTANEQRRCNLGRAIADLELEEQKLLEDYEVIEDPSAEIQLFKGLHRVTDERGKTYWEVPERIIVSNRHGILVLSVALWRNPDMDDDNQLDWTGDVSILVSEDDKTANELWVPYCCPFEAVDERGVPSDRNKKRVRVEVNLCSPFRSLSATRGLEEQRLIAEANGQQFVAQLDGDRAAGDQGLGGVTFTSFRNTTSEQTYHEFREVGSRIPGEKGDITSPLASDLLIPLDDIDESLDFQIRFPGLGGS